VTPLWHGVDLCRGLTLGTIGWAAALGHAAYLLAWAAVGLFAAQRTYTRRLMR
jgi:lipooligosaccharide transport system permease protein